MKLWRDKFKVHRKWRFRKEDFNPSSMTIDRMIIKLMFDKISERMNERISAADSLKEFVSFSLELIPFSE